MSEIWLRINIFVRPEDNSKILLRVIKPVTEKLERENLLETFHFFFEPQIDFRIRTTSKDNIQGKIKTIMEKILTNEDLVKNKDFKFYEDYTGEQDNFGEEGWKIVQRCFEYGSRIALLNIDKTIQKGREFNERKFVHCFLNQLGYTIPNEAVFHSNATVERVIMLSSLQYGELSRRLGKIEERISKLENKSYR